MTLDEYQVKAKSTAVFPTCLVDSVTQNGIVTQRPANFVYPALGLAGEAGEVADKYKKIIRDNHGVFTIEDKESIAYELGDVLWYVAVLADDLGYSLDKIGEMNTEKLTSRKIRNKLSGNGDNR